MKALPAALVGMLACMGAACAEPSEPARLAPQSLLLDVAQAGNALVAVGERGHVLRLDNGGANWQQVITPTRALLTAVTFADAAHGWAVGQDATILATSDGGATWVQQFDTTQLPEDDPARDAPLLAISCNSATTCAAAGAYGLLLLTHDGSNWQRLHVKEDDRNFYAVHMFDAQHLLIAGEAGALMESTDGGAEWSTLATPYDGSFFGFLALPDGGWLLFGLRGHVLRSDDKGANWQTVQTGVDTGLMGGSVLPDGRIALAGAGGVVLLSHDNAHSFTLQRQSSRVALSTIINAGNNLLLFGEKGVQTFEADDAH